MQDVAWGQVQNVLKLPVLERNTGSNTASRLNRSYTTVSITTVKLSTS